MSVKTQFGIGEPFQVMLDVVRVHVAAEQTDGAFFAIEVDVAPGGGPPPLHTHEAAEYFWTLRGNLSYFRREPDGEVVEITGGPGTSAFIPGGVPHTYRNLSSEPAAYLAVLSPAQAMQDFLLEVARERGSEPLSPEYVLEVGERFGMTTLDIVPGGE